MSTTPVRLQAQSNVKLVGYTAQPLHEAVDAAIGELLDQEAGTHPPSGSMFTQIG